MVDQLNEDPTPVLGDHSTYMVGGIIGLVIIALVAGAIVGYIARQFDRRASWVAGVVLLAISIVGGPVGFVIALAVCVGAYLGQRPLPRLRQH